MAKFKLTDTADNVEGTTDDDRIVGKAGTLQSEDRIDGGSGFDTLVANAEQNGAQAPVISNVEDLFIDTGGLAFDISNVSGAERIISDKASIIIEPVDTDDLGIRFGGDDVGSGTVKIQFADGALAAADDTLKLEAIASNVTFTSDSTFDGTEDGIDNPTEDRLKVENIDLVLSGKENQVDISDFTEIESLTLSGDATSKVVVSSPKLEEIDASATTGGITLTSDIEGNQIVEGGSGDDDLKTGSGNDDIDSGDGDDVITAGGGNNIIRTGDGKDEVSAEQGDDDIYLGRGDDFVNSGSGADTIRGGAGNDEIIAGDGADTIYGGNNEDIIRGQGGADIIYDGRNEDTVYGGGDNDTFFAGQGDDTFTGGGGVDTFDFTEEKFGNDEVTDFTLTTNASTNDIVMFEADGAEYTLQSKDDFEAFVDGNPDITDFSTNQDFVSITADMGQILLQVSDADFLG
ncbi:calcium-binding protein [Limimaricola sp. AA108-03]|uniref:calcium-binding protein n=1 Tax=Limimaricola sp. AA108-03 TaxID=3425945 RepID=UPI003D7728EC